MKKIFILLPVLLLVVVAGATTPGATGFFWEAGDGTEMVSVSTTFVNNSGEPMAAQRVTVPVTMEDGTPLSLNYNLPALDAGESCSCSVSAPTENILWGENGQGILFANILWGEGEGVLFAKILCGG